MRAVSRLVVCGSLAAALMAAASRGHLLAAKEAARPAPAASHRPAPMPAGERYPYRSAAFTRFVADSYHGSGKDPHEFTRWFEHAYSTGKVRAAGRESLGLPALLAWKRGQLAGIADPRKRAQAEITFAGWVHKVVKADIPRFSLDRGFEFTNVVKYGERQCFLQSVLIAGLLQSAGMHAGVVMVNQSEAGEESNNGHAVTLVKLPDGRDILVDASEREPFPRHRGLFVSASGYRYVVPAYDKDDAVIGYRPASGKGMIDVASVRTLDVSFLRSQFDYYRGERALGGILAAHPTPAGLAASASALEKSVRLCPQNPLAVYMLGRALKMQGKRAPALTRFEDAYKLYAKDGWVPPGPAEYLAGARAESGSAGG